MVGQSGRSGKSTYGIDPGADHLLLVPAPGLLSQHIHHPIRQALVAQQDVALRVGGDLLRDLQLAEAHQRRVVGQQLGGVGLAAHGGRFLTASDEVGLGGLLGLRDTVQSLIACS
jgi:hypothetical protein